MSYSPCSFSEGREPQDVKPRPPALRRRITKGAAVQAVPHYRAADAQDHLREPGRPLTASFLQPTGSRPRHLSMRLSVGMGNRTSPGVGRRWSTGLVVRRDYSIGDILSTENGTWWRRFVCGATCRGRA